ncbi:MAG: cation:proton antiporter [Trueperaceae bacterium]|nr:MAG: cation:proton antiporter [Trueperaceae bacterium]
MSPILEFGLIALGLYTAGWISQRLGISAIVGYILLGIILGPHGIYTLYQETELIELLGELGIVLLLFYLGLEFSLSRFLESGRSTLLAGSLDLVNLVVGVGVGLVLGLGWLASLFLGGIVYISSSGVIAKLLAERDLVAYPETERTLGVLVFEDLAMVVILTGLGLITLGGGLIDALGVLFFLLIALLLLRFGRGLVDRLLSREGEAFVLLSLALVVLFSVLAKSLGFPEAVAAFLFGMVVAESRFKERVEQTLQSWHSVGAAVFFLGFGLHVDARAAVKQLPAALLLVVVTIVANMMTGYLSGRWSGLSRRASVGHGLMLLPRGEFSLVIAGLAAGVTSLPQETRTALSGMSSLYVIAMVVIGSFVFRYFDQINGWLEAKLKTPAERQAEATRQRELDAMRLDEKSLR